LAEPLVTIVIASRKNAQGLWMSINNIEWELKEAGIDFQFAIVTNDDGKLDTDSRQVIEMLRTKTGYLKYYRHNELPMTPQQARQEAIDNTNSKYIICFDNHVQLCPGFFKRFFHDWESTEADILHSATQYYINDFICYNYKLQLKKDFWGVSDSFALNEYKPFKIGAAGHGGVGFKRSSFEKYSGYKLSSSFVGYSGEELTADLGTWLQGGNVYISPRSIHRHWAATTRGYGRHHTEDFYKNLFSCAFILANETADDYVYTMMDHFKSCSKPYLKKPMFDILMEAKERSKQDANWIKERRVRTIEEQLEKFELEEVAYR